MAANLRALLQREIREHTYSVEGEYTVTVSGTLTWFGSDSWEPCPNIDKLTKVISFESWVEELYPVLL